MSDTEQRRPRRESTTLVVDYEGADELVAEVTETLAAGHTFIHTERTLAVGAELELALSFPGLLTPVRLPVVVRSTGDAGEHGEAAGVGVEIRRDAGDVAAVTKLLERIARGDTALIGRVCQVLIVEDNPHVARLIREGLIGGTRRAFDDVRFVFETAANGRDALAMLTARRFDIMVIDIYLPVLDGPSVIREVRASKALRSLPIIAVSAGGTSAQEEALEAGADFFLAKPMRLTDLVESMRKLMPASD